MTPIDFSFSTVRLRCQIRSQQPSVCQDFLGFPWRYPEAGQSGAFERIATVERTMSETLRFNIVIFVAFRERETHICVVHVPALGIPDVEYTNSFLIPGRAPLSSASFFARLFSRDVQCITSLDVTYFDRNFWWYQFGR